MLVLLGLSFFLLGAYRLLALRPDVSVKSLEQVSGPSVGDQLPQTVEQRLTLPPSGRHLLLAFVTDGCPACGGLIASLRAGHGRTHDLEVAFIVGSSSPVFTEQLADGIVGDVIDDQDSTIYTACAIAATPMIMLVDSRGKIIDKRISSDPTEVLLALQGTSG